MPMEVGVGQAFSVEGREAVARAVYEARGALGNLPIDFAVIISSFEYDFQEITTVAQTQIGDVPMIGFSTSGEINKQGVHRRSVVVALVVDPSLDVQTDWLPGFSNDSRQITSEILQMVGFSPERQGMLMLVADGLNGDYEGLTNTLPPGRYKLTGCLAGGDLRAGKTYQLGSGKSGSSGLAGAFVSGDQFRVGVGTAHGWQPIGTQLKVTTARGPWIRSLNGKVASESYAELFGQEPQDWVFPPLNSLVRLYPLGIERDNRPLLVRTPLRVEADGSFRMNAELSDGTVGHLMVGSRENCKLAARQAALDALEDLDGAEPKLALIFVDVAWQLLFQGFEGAEVEAVKEVLGDSVPIAGGYTFGQFNHMSGAPRPEFLNQHIEVILIGESGSE
ncbi:MAG TPA: FIST N-terminal domain-containing protein [Anaerolineales bacterium]|nr:FIST N-terminal domain-containing protein [Anaerolineales bacterium]